MVGLCLFLCSCLASPGARFYVDSNAGDDQNPGTSAAQPWRSLEKVNATTFAPGDRVRFQAGSAWSGPLVITARGAVDQPVVFERSGNGPRPRIDAAGKFEDAIIISNAQHVVLRDFEVTNKGDDRFRC